MTGYLTQLAARSLSLGDTVRPRIAAIFDPTGAADAYPQAGDAWSHPTAGWPQLAGDPGADQVFLSPPPGGQAPMGTSRLETRPERPASRREVPADRPPALDLAAEPPTQLPALGEAETSQPPRSAARAATAATPSQAGSAAGPRTQAAPLRRYGTRGGSTATQDRPSHAGSRTRVPLPGQPPVPAGENPAQPPAGDRAAPAREAPAMADSIAFRQGERGADSVPVPGAAHGPAVSAAQGPPGAGHFPTPVTIRTRRPYRTESNSADDPFQPTATVQVTIGRVEVRAVSAPAPRTRPDAERRPMITLAEHLQAREAGR